MRWIIVFCILFSAAFMSIAETRDIRGDGIAKHSDVAGSQQSLEVDSVAIAPAIGA